MSDNIDKRVVQLDFDNAKFEKNTKQSMATLSKLEDSLNFDGVADSISKVEVKFSALQVAAITAISNITNKIVNLGEQLVKSLSIDQISAGWEKYAQKSTSLATLMAQTISVAGKELTDETEKYSEVNTQLEKLNWFADETSYSFTDMVSNVGKFTAAGQDLDKSVEAMMGIANWAALSGQNATTASQAMYQLAQAMGKGNVQLIDYKSIQNANMDTQEFRQTILDTAVAMGELTKAGDTYTTKTGKNFTKAQFTEQLSEKWFTSDVLTTGLKKYSAAVDKIYEISEETGLTASEVISRYGDELDTFGLKAFKAAQEARTFSDALNSVKDAVSSKWLETAEKIFGSYTDATSLWTDLANELYDLFAESGNFRNEILSVWDDLEGRADLFAHDSSNPDEQGAFWNIYDAAIEVIDIIKSAWNTIFPKSLMKNYDDQVNDIASTFKTFTSNLQKFAAEIRLSEKESTKLKQIFQGLFSILKIGLLTLKSIRLAIDPIIDLAKEFINKIYDKLAMFGPNLDFIETIAESLYGISNKISNAIEQIIELIDPSGIVGKFLDFLENIKKIIIDTHPIENIVNFIKEFVNIFKESGGTLENITSIFNGIISVISMLGKVFLILTKFIVTYVLPILGNVMSIASRILAVFGGLATKILAFIGDMLSNLNALFSGVNKFSGTSEKIINFFQTLPSILAKLLPILSSLGRILKGLFDIVMLIPNMLNKVSKSLTGRGLIENVELIFNKIADAIETFVSSMKNLDTDKLKTVMSPIIDLFNGIKSVFVGLISVIKGFATLFGKVLSFLGKALQTLGDALKNFSVTLSGSKKNINWWLVAVLGYIALILFAARSIYYATLAVFAPLQVIADSLSGAIDALAHKWNAEVVEILANSLDIFAKSILKITVSLLILSRINTSDLKKALAVFAIITVILMGVVALMSYIYKATVTSVKYSKGIKEAVTKLVDSMRNVVRQYQKLAGLQAMTTFVSVFSSAMIKIAIAFAILGKISWENLSKGLIVMSVFIGELLLVSKLAGDKTANVKKSIPGILQLVAFSGVLLIFAKVIEKLNGYSWQELIKTTLAISAFILAFGATIYIMNRSFSIGNKFWSELSQMIMVAVLLKMFTQSVLQLSSIPWDKLLLSTGAIILFIASFGILIAMMNVSTSKSKDPKVAAATMKSIAVFASSLMVFANCVKLLSSISIGSLIMASAVILGFVGVMAAVMVLSKNVMNVEVASNMLAFAGSVIIFSGAILILAAAMMVVSNVSWEGIAKGLVVMAGAIIVLAVTSALLSPLIGTMVLFAAAIALIGFGLLATALSISAFAAGLVSFAAIVVANAAVIGLALTTLGTLLVTALVESFKLFLDSLNDIIPKIVELIETFTLSIIELIFGLRDKITNLLLSLLQSLLDTLLAYIPSICTTIHTIFMTVLSFVKDHIQETVELLIDIFVNIRNAFSNKIDKVVTALTDFAKNLISTFHKNSSSLIDLIWKCLKESITNIINVFVKEVLPLAALMAKAMLIYVSTSFTLFIKSIGYLAKYILIFFTGLILLAVSVANGLRPILKEALKSIGANILLVFVDVLENLGPDIIKTFRVLFKAIWNGAIESIASIFDGWGQWIADRIRGMKDTSEVSMVDDLKELASGSALKNAIENVGSNISDTINYVSDALNDTTSEGIGSINDTITDSLSQFEESGQYVTEGFADGILDDSTSVSDAAETLANTVATTVTDTLGIHSPSRVMAALGQYISEGLANGISSKEDNISNAMSDSILLALNTAESTLDEGIDDEMVITPVLDLSKIQNGKSELSSLMSGIGDVGTSVSLANETSGEIASSKTSKINSRDSSSTASSSVTHNDQIYNTFNISGSDPDAIADAIDKKLQQTKLRRKAANG